MELQQPKKCITHNYIINIKYNQTASKNNKSIPKVYKKSSMKFENEIEKNKMC